MKDGQGYRVSQQPNRCGHGYQSRQMFIPRIFTATFERGTLIIELKSKSFSTFMIIPIIIYINPAVNLGIVIFPLASLDFSFGFIFPQIKAIEPFWAILGQNRLKWTASGNLFLFSHQPEVCISFSFCFMYATSAASCLNPFCAFWTKNCFNCLNW